MEAWCPYLNLFCYLCGHWIPRPDKQRSGKIPKRRRVTDCEFFLSGYGNYYVDHPPMFDKPWTPKTICDNCYTGMIKWQEGTRISMPYGTPILWPEHVERHEKERCYGCRNEGLITKGMTKKKAKKLQYTYDIEFASEPLRHTDANPPPPKPRSPDRVTGMTYETEYIVISPRRTTRTMSSLKMRAHHSQ